jgi:hypothetical protein
MFNRSIIGDGIVPIAGPDPDPNVTPPPDDRIITLESATPIGGQWLAWVAAQGGGPTVELWVLIDFTPPGGAADTWWFRWNNAALVVPMDQAVPFPTNGVPVTTKSAFLRITAVGGATRIVLGLTT